MKQDRNEVTDRFVNWFGDREQGYFITLNTKMRLPTPRNDRQVSNSFTKCGTEVRQTMNFLSEYCYGRQALQGKSLAMAFAIEIGASDDDVRADRRRPDRCDMVHAHIVAAHNGDTDRDVESVKKFLDRKWGLIYDTRGSDAFVNVKPLDVLRYRVWYLTKDSAKIERHLGECNLALH